MTEQLPLLRPADLTGKPPLVTSSPLFPKYFDFQCACGLRYLNFRFDWFAWKLDGAVKPYVMVECSACGTTARVVVPLAAMTPRERKHYGAGARARSAGKTAE